MSDLRIVKGGVCAARGFRAAGVAAEIKYKGRNDVALVVADAPCAAAAVFTTNKVAAAPVIYDREIVAGGRVQAILANSGCANACTGERGLRDARLAALTTAGELGLDPRHVLVASTGVIGRPLPMDRLLAGMRAATRRLGRSQVTVGGMAKGSGMIEPNMATMLGFITTDAAVSPAMLRRALGLAIARSFNRLVVDGDESTNDSVFLLASGAAGNCEITRAGADFDAFLEALMAVCVSLTRQMATDGEGATKFVTVTVRGARTAKDAERAARAIAKSPLAKTSWFGRDPNWGRVLAAVGYSGADVVDMKAEVFYDGIWAFRRGEVADAAQLGRLARVLRRRAFEVVVFFFNDTATTEIYTCDLSLDYVHINADYTT